jgi:nitrate reductase gamma subunit
MTDRWLLVVWPYVAAAAFVVVPTVWLLVLAHPWRDLRAQVRSDAACVWGALWRYGMLSVLAGHALILALPDRVLAWNRSPVRLVALEAVLFAAGCAATVGFIALTVRGTATPRRGPASLVDSVLRSLLTLALVSGLLMSVHHRWASSWSAVTLAPYVASVIRFEPDPSLVADMPFLVRLHLVTALALTTLLPLRLPLLVGMLRPFYGFIRWLAMPAARVAHVVHDVLRARAWPRVAGLLWCERQED